MEYTIIPEETEGLFHVINHSNKKEYDVDIKKPNCKCEAGKYKKICGHLQMCCNLTTSNDIHFLGGWLGLSAPFSFFQKGPTMEKMMACVHGNLKIVAGTIRTIGSGIISLGSKLRRFKKK